MPAIAKAVPQVRATAVLRSYWLASALIGGALLLSAVIGASVIEFTPLSIEQFSKALLPLAVISLILERVIEVFVAPWRDARKTNLENEIRAREAAGQDSSAAQEALTAWRAESQKIAFLAATFVGLLAAAVGFRALEGLADPAAVATYSQFQLAAFRSFDVVVTAGLLAGGADFVHRFVSAITNFMDTGSRAAKTRALH
jgi:hypothetical protein